MKVPAFQALLALALVAGAGCASHKAESKFSTTPASYKTPYNQPLTTPGACFAALPMVVQNTVVSEAGSAEIVDVFKDVKGNRVFYKITFRDGEVYPPMFVGADGSVLNPDLTVCVPAPQAQVFQVKEADLPLDVLNTVRASRPGAEITGATKEHWGDHTVYIVSFKDEVRHSKLHVVADGTVLATAPK